MVDVGMAAQNGHRRQPRLVQGGLQFRPLVHGARVQQDAPGVVHLVEGDELPAFQHPGVALDTFQFHSASLFLLSLPRRRGRLGGDGVIPGCVGPG